MKQQSQAIERSEEADWPYASLLFLGSFGVRSKSGRVLAITSGISGLVMGWSLAMLTSDGPPPLLPAQAWALMLPLSAVPIMIALHRYLASLDELTRNMQLCSLAVGYGVAAILCMAVIGAVLAAPAGSLSSLHPVVYFIPLLIAETARGMTLVVLARRYR